MVRSIVALGLLWLFISAAPVSAQTVLTLSQVVARARSDAAAVIVARARVAEAEAALVGASVRFRSNPELDVAAGPRATGNGRSADVDIALRQQFESGGQRRARIDVAQADVERERAEVEAAARDSAYDAATAFVRGVAARERLRVAEEADAVSRDLLGAVDRRYAAGDVAAIDVNLARIDAARAAAAVRSARVQLAEAIALLQAILRLPAADAVDLDGSLDLPAPPALDALQAAIDERPQLAALSAEAGAADAEVRLARAMRRPDLGLRASYEREDGDQIVLAGLSVALPAFDRAQGPLAAGLAHASRVRLELETTRERARADLAAAYAAYEQRRALTDTLARDALASTADNASLARRSYEAGEMNLIDLLLVRRDALATRTELVDRGLDTALSRLAVDHLAGVLR